MDEKLLTKDILSRARQLALTEWVDRAVGEFFNVECHARGYVGALVANGYTVVIERGDEKYKYPKE